MKNCEIDFFYDSKATTKISEAERESKPPITCIRQILQMTRMGNGGGVNMDPPVGYASNNPDGELLFYKGLFSFTVRDR